MLWSSSAAPGPSAGRLSSRRPLLIRQASVTHGLTSTVFLAGLCPAASFHQIKEGASPGSRYSMRLMASVGRMLCFLAGWAIDPLLLCAFISAAFPPAFGDVGVVWAFLDKAGACLKELSAVLHRWRGVLLESKCVSDSCTREKPPAPVIKLLFLPPAVPGDAVLGLLPSATPK